MLKNRVGFEPYRAARIARTEIISSSNYGSMRGAQETGFLLNKEWLSAIDSRTRTIPSDQFDHRAMDEVQVGMDEFFKVPKKGGGFELLALPGDHSGSVGNTVNCRCTLAYIPLD